MIVKGGGGMATDAIRRAVKKYDAKNTVQFHLKLNRRKDAEIIEYLQQSGNVQGYIKELITADLKTKRGVSLSDRLSTETENPQEG